MSVLVADEAPGTHPTINLCGSGCAVNYQTVISSLIAIAITVAMGLLLAYRLSHGRPGKLQMVFELFLGYVRNMVREGVAEDAMFVIPLAATIGFYILVANWLDFFPLQKPIEPANSDLNQTAAMGIVVILVVQWYSVRVLGWRRYFYRFTKPFEMNKVVRTVFIPLNVIEEIVKPVTLSLRLFGNIFAGVVMVFLLGQLFAAGSNVLAHAAFGGFSLALLVLWKFFDVFFVGTIQAFIFMLLTIIYFGMAREGLEEEGHGAHGAHPATA